MVTARERRKALISGGMTSTKQATALQKRRETLTKQQQEKQIQDLKNKQQAQVNKLKSELAIAQKKSQTQSRRSSRTAWGIKANLLREAINTLGTDIILTDKDVNDILSQASSARSQAYSKLRNQEKLGEFNLKVRAQTVAETIPVQVVTKEEIKARQPLSLKQIQKTQKVKVQQLDRNKLKTDYNKAFNEALKGTRPDTRKLFALGLSGDAVTNIVRAYETSPTELSKLRDTSFDKVWSELNKKKTLTVDRTTQEKAYKVTVNQELKRSGLEQISFSKSLKDFEKEYKKLLDKRKEIQKQLTQKVNEKTLNQFVGNSLSIQNKALTGQTMTPTEMKLYQQQIESQNKKLTQSQINTAKKLLLSPVNYGRNLKIRYDNGENALLTDFNRVGKVGKGVLKEVGDTINFVLGVKGITINSRGESFDGIIATGARAFFNYETRVIKELTKGKSVKNVIGDDLKKIAKKSKEIKNKTVNVVNFVRQNPVGTLIIVSAALEAGVISSNKAFFRNPEENIGRAIVWLFPAKIIQGVAKGLKAGEKLVDSSVNTLSKLNKYVKNTKVPVVKRKATTYSFMIKNPTFKDLVKNYTQEKFIKLKMSRVNKIVAKANKKQKIEFKAGTVVSRARDNLINTINKASTIPKTILKKIDDAKLKSINNKVKASKDTAVITFTVGSTKQDRIKKLQSVLGMPRKYLKQLNLKQINRAAKKLNSKKVRFKIGEIDKPKRRKVLAGKKARVGIPKTVMKQVNKVDDKAKQTMREGLKIGKDDIVRFTIGEVKDKNKVSFTIGKQIKKNNVLRKQIKETLSRLKQFNKTTVLTSSELKLFKSLTRLNILNKYLSSIRTLRIGRTTATRKDIKKAIDTLRDQLRDSLKDVDTQLKRAQDSKRLTDTGVKRLSDVARKVKVDVKKIQKLAAAAKTLKTVKKPRRLPKIKIKLNINTLPRDQVAIFEGVYRERKYKTRKAGKQNPIVRKKIRIASTKNRVLNKLATLIDNSAARSMEVKLIKVIDKKIKEVQRTKTLGKFRLKKGKNVKVLRLVEKTKYIRDKKQEKKEISPKGRRRIKKVVKKGIKKTKKSSNTKRKKLKAKKTSKKKVRKKK